MNIVKLKLSELTPYKNNAKIHTPEQIEQIKDSIKEFGMNDPIAVWGDKNIIVEGHGRVLALKELGWEEVECIRLDHLSEAERKAYTIAHNKLTMNTDFDNELLAVDFAELQELDFDLESTGFQMGEIEGILNPEEEAPKERKDLSGEIGETYEIVVECEDEEEMEQIYYKLIEEGLKCRTLIL